MSARINMPTQVGGTGLANTLASALFGDPQTEIALAKMRSQLMTDAWQRQQMESVTDYNNMRTQTGQWELEGRQGMVPAVQKLLYGAQGPEPAAPAPVDLSGPEVNAPIPLPRPSDMPAEVAPVPYQQTEPDVQVSPTNYPLRSEADMYTYGPEPDMRFGASGIVPPGLPEIAPVPVRRPGDLPPFKPGLGYVQDVPPDLMPGAQAAPTTVPPDQREIDPRRSIVTDPVYSTFGDRPPIPLAPAPFDPSNFFSSSPTLQGLNGMQPTLPEYRPPEPVPVFPASVPPETLPTRPAMDTGRYPADVPAFQPDGQLAGVPPDLQSIAAQLAQRNTTPALTGVPPDLQPAPVSVPEPEAWQTNPSLGQVPPELTPANLGTSVEVPGRPQPPAPLPAQPGGPAVTVPGRTTTDTPHDRPPPVSPDAPLSPNAFPITATGDVLVEPETQTVVVQTPQGGQRFTLEEMGQFAKGIVAQSTGAGDLTAGIGRAAGLIGLQSGTLTPDQQRIAAMEYTGNLPGTGTMITSQDTAPATFEAQKAAATEAVKPDDFKDVVEGKPGEFFRRTRNPDGSVSITPIATAGAAGGGPEITLPNKIQDIEGTGAEVAYINTINEVLNMVRENPGKPVHPAIQNMYSEAWNQLHGEKVTQALVEKGLQTVITQSGAPGIPSPQELFGANFAAAPGAGGAAPAAPAAPAGATAPALAATGTQGAAAAAAAATPGEGGSAVAPAAAPAEDKPVYVGSHTSTVTDRATNQKLQVKNYGGWSGEGETDPTEQTVTTTPGGQKITNILNPQKRTKAMGDASQRAFTMGMEAIRAMKMLDETDPSKVPGSFQQALTTIQRLVDTTPSGVPIDAVVNSLVDPEARRYARAIFTFINAKLRPDTGAAISKDEFYLYKDRFAMHPGEGVDGYIDTRLYRNDALRSIRMALTSEATAEDLKAFDTELAKQGIDLEWDGEAVRAKVKGRPKTTGTGGKPTVRPDGHGGYIEVPGNG